jgi:Domain of unknown function (DUF1788)
VSKEKLGERLGKLADTLSNEQLLHNRGIGNEIGFYIFAYSPEFEPLVTNYLPRLKAQLTTRGLTVLEFNLYDLILEVLNERKLLEKSFELEAQKGSQGLYDALKKIVRSEKILERIAQRLGNPHDLVFITGIGAAYPLIRSHTVLNNLHEMIDKVPLVMFFPGTWDGQTLRLFGELKDDNYYRAFAL